jgi:hypothetical protein
MWVDIDPHASSSTKTNDSAMKIHLIQFVQDESGLDQKNIKTNDDLRNKLDLKDTDVEQFFYNIAFFWSFVLLKTGGKPYEIGSILQWMSALIAYFRLRPDTKENLGRMVVDTHNHNVPVWLSTCRGRVERAYLLKFTINADPVDEDDDEDTTAIYSPRLGPYMKRFLLEGQGSFHDNAEKRFTDLLQFHNCARGCEGKLTMWTGKNGAKFDDLLKLLIWGWLESKGCRFYPLACIPHAFSYMMCMVHGLAVYVLAGGLGRVDSTASKANSVVFSFQSVASSRVSILIGKNLPEGITSKALRKGAVTEMENHPTCDHKFSLLRSGHAGGDVSRTSYYQQTTLSSLAGGKALCGYANVHQPVSMATLPADLIPIQDKLIEKFFFINISPFLGEGHLTPLLPYLVASLIQYYNKMLEDGYTTGNCPTINKLVVGVMELFDVSASVSASKLKGWSTEVQENFTAMNAMATGNIASTDEIRDTLQANAVVSATILKKLTSIETRLSTLEASLQGVSDGVTDLGSPAGTPPQLKRRVELDDESSSSSSSSSSSKKVKAEQNEKQWNIDKVLEAVVRGGAIEGEGEEFCLEFCKTLCKPNEQAKMRKTLKFVYENIEDDEMAVLKVGDPKNDNEKVAKLKTA